MTPSARLIERPTAHHATSLVPVRITPLSPDEEEKKIASSVKFGPITVGFEDLAAIESNPRAGILALRCKGATVIWLKSSPEEMDQLVRDFRAYQAAAYNSF